MKNFLLKLLLRWYVNNSRKTSKLSIEDELAAYLWRDTESVEKCIRNEMHASTLWYFDAKEGLEQHIVKGEALAFQKLLEKHNMAKLLVQQNKEMDKVIEKWKNYKIKGL